MDFTEDEITVLKKVAAAFSSAQEIGDLDDSDGKVANKQIEVHDTSTGTTGKMPLSNVTQQAVQDTGSVDATEELAETDSVQVIIDSKPLQITLANFKEKAGINKKLEETDVYTKKQMDESFATTVYYREVTTETSETSETNS